MIMRSTSKVCLCETIDILEVGFLFPLVQAGSLMIQIHEDAILVAHLIHYVLICFVSTV